MAKTKFTTTVDSEILKLLKIQAASEEISVGELIERMFEKYPNKIIITSPTNKQQI